MKIKATVKSIGGVGRYTVIDMGCEECKHRLQALTSPAGLIGNKCSSSGLEIDHLFPKQQGSNKEAKVPTCFQLGGWVQSEGCMFKGECSNHERV
ncbi:hypothetical protein KAR91_68845 [Candidatus Pacearchaeota archaeon]|nr:hypothetical protein [Candidatus Pacearchaeota archaeon]